MQNSIERSSQGAVGGQISVSAEAIQNVSRSLSGGASLNSSSSIGVEEGSFQDPYYSSGLMDRLLAIDEQFPDRVQALQSLTQTIKFRRMGEAGIYVRTLSSYGTSRFKNYYWKDFMKFMESYRRSDGKDYYLTDLIRIQYRLAAKEGDFLNYLPRKLIRSMITNEKTNKIIEEFREHPRFLSIFLLDTVNGRSSLRVMNDFGLRPTSIHVNDFDVTISVEPDPNPIPVDQLQKAQKNLRGRLESLNLLD